MFRQFLPTEPKVGPKPASKRAKGASNKTVKVKKLDGTVVTIQDKFKNSLLQARYGKLWWDESKPEKKRRQEEQRNFRTGDMTGIFGGDGPPAPAPPAPAPPAQPAPPLECWQRPEEDCYAFHLGFETDSGMYTGWPSDMKRKIKALKEKILADIGKILVKNEDYTMQFGTALQEAHGWTYYAKEVDDYDDTFPGGEDVDRVVKKLEEKGYEVEDAGDSDGGWESYQSYMVYPKNLDARTKSLLTWHEGAQPQKPAAPAAPKPTAQPAPPPAQPAPAPPSKASSKASSKAKKPPGYQRPFIGLSTGLFIDDEKAKEIDTFLTDKFQQHIPGWTFKWDNAVQRYGICIYTNKCISVSLPLAKVNEIERTKRTILHEIAHALTPGAKHSNKWKKKAEAIGLSNPTTCCTKEDAVCMDRMKWALRNCETYEVYHYYTREPKDKIWSTRYIPGKKKETIGKLEIVKLGP